MGKGAVDGGSELYLGTAALSENDYVHDAIDEADLIISIGHDTIEKPPFLMSKQARDVIHLGFLPASVEEVYFPQHEVIGDIAGGLDQLGDRLEGKLQSDGFLLGLRKRVARTNATPPSPCNIFAPLRSRPPRRRRPEGLNDGLDKIIRFIEEHGLL